MQDQGKRLLLAVALMLGVLLIWQQFFPPKEKVGSQDPTAPSVGPTKPTSPVDYAAPSGPDDATGNSPELIRMSTPAFTAVFSARNAALVSWKLSDQRYERDATGGELGSDVGSFQLGFTKDSAIKLPKDTTWVGTKTNDRQVTYKLSVNDFDIVKIYDLVPEAYLVRITLQITSKVKAAQRPAITTYIYQDPTQGGEGSSHVQARVWHSATLRNGAHLQTTLAQLGEWPRFEQNIQWTGFEQPYLLVGVAPKPVVSSPVQKHTYAESNPELAQAVREFLIDHKSEAISKIAAAATMHGRSGLIRTDIVFPQVAFNPGETWSRELVAYLGPKNFDALSRADVAAGFATGFHQVVDLGWFAFIGKPLLWLLRELNGLFGNWGIAIVALTVIVKLATLYWMTKSMRSMKAMAVLGPQIKSLSEKYKDNRQKLQAETMALYKENGANPLSGCLPMLLQAPIWIALYRMLSSAGELYRQPFIPGWIADLTIADPYYILPIVLTATMFAQARLTPQNPDPAQQVQQKIMQYGMPLMFGGMAFVFPAGLTLYIFTNTCLSALHSIYMNKYDKKSIELTARLQAAQAKAAADKLKDSAKAAKDATPIRVDAHANEVSEIGSEVAQPTSAMGARASARHRSKKKRR